MFVSGERWGILILSCPGSVMTALILSYQVRLILQAVFQHYRPLSDSLFSLIIFIYVAVTFLYIFYAFCWREAPRKELTEEEKKVRIRAL